MTERTNDLEKRTEEQILVREVTHLQASWVERERGAPDTFTFQLMLDQGADEYIVLRRPTTRRCCFSSSSPAPGRCSTARGRC